VQASFSDLEYDAKKRLTPRDRFLAEIESETLERWCSDAVLTTAALDDPSQTGPGGRIRQLGMSTSSIPTGRSCESLCDINTSTTTGSV